MRPQLSTRFTGLAFLGWCPETICAKAIASSPPKALVTGVLASTSQTALVAAAIVGWLDEPFPDLTVYLLQALRALPLVCASLIAFFGIAFTIALLVEDTLTAKIICISPLSTVIPGFVWSVFAVMAGLGDPANNVWPGASKPAWLTSEPIGFLGSFLWVPVFLYLVVGVRCMNST